MPSYQHADPLDGRDVGDMLVNWELLSGAGTITQGGKMRGPAECVANEFLNVDREFKQNGGPLRMVAMIVWLR